MKVNVEIDDEATALEVLIRHHTFDEEVEELLNRLKEKKRMYFVGHQKGVQHVFQPKELIYLFTENDTVNALTKKGTFLMKERLYQLEEELPEHQFIRISKSVIANLDELSRFEASFNGTLCVYFRTGAKEYVSRQYVSNIKKAFQWKRKGSL